MTASAQSIVRPGASTHQPREFSSGQPIEAQPRKSAEIVQLPRKFRPLSGAELSEACARLVSVAFPGPSQHAQALSAARHIGCSPDTIERILSKQTQRHDMGLMIAVLGVYQERTGRGFELGDKTVLQIALDGYP